MKGIHPQNPSGFTLFEIMLVLSILVVLCLVSGPQLTAVIERNIVRLQANNLITSLNLARNEAISRNVSVVMCPSRAAMAEHMECGGNYSDGWIVFSDEDDNREYSQGDDTLIQLFSALAKGYRVTNRKGTRLSTEVVTYYGDGTSRRNLTLQVCPPQGSVVGPRSIILNMVGRPRVQDDWGACHLEN